MVLDFTLELVGLLHFCQVSYIFNQTPSVSGWRWAVLQLIIAFLSVCLFSRKKLEDTAE